MILTHKCKFKKVIQAGTKKIRIKTGLEQCQICTRVRRSKLKIKA